MEVDRSLLMEEVQLEQMQSTLLKGKEQCPKDLLDAESHPTDQTLVMFANLIYVPKKSSTLSVWGSSLETDADYGTRILLDKLQGWKILITATNTNVSNGYFGAAFVHTGLQQVVVAHRGTDPKHFGPLYTDVQGIFRTQYTSCMTSAVTFMDHIRQAINSANNQQRHYTLAITGHSLGAWLAQITTFSVKYLAINQNRLEKKPEVGIHAKTVGFDSPGARDMLDRVLDDYYDRYAMHVYLDRLNITLYLSAPNHINTCGEHLGRIYRIFINLSNFNVIDTHTFKYTLTTHSMSNFVKALIADENGTTNIGEVLDWPKNIEEYDELFKILEKKNNYHENAKDDPKFLMEKLLEHRYKVLEPKSPENVDIFCKCNFRVFAEDELEMLYKLHELREQKSELNVLNEFIRMQLDGYNMEITELFPNFNIDHNHRTIECKPVETLAELKSPKNTEILKNSFKDFSEDKLQLLYKLLEQQVQKSENTDRELVQKNLKVEIAKHLPDFDIEHYNRRKSQKSLAVLCNRLKQLMRWLKPEFTQAMDKQIKVFPYAADFIYFAEGQSYLNLLPKCCLDFEDLVNLRGFLDSDTERVLCIVTHSGDGAFQMIRLRNILHQIQRSVDSSDGVKKYFSGNRYTFLGWPQIRKLHPIYGWPTGKEYMMVVDNTSSSINLEDHSKLLNHVHSKSLKLILITSQSVDTSNTSELIKRVNSVVNLTDLNLDSQKKLLERANVIITEDRGFSFRQFFGDYFSLDDLKQILSSKCLKNFITIENYAIILKDTRPALSDLEVPFFKLNVKISKNLILSYVDSPNNKILVVINGLSREELETQSDWQQLNGKVILAEGDPELFFKDTCNKNQHNTIYLLEVSEGEVYCKQIYDKDFNLPRTFLHRAHIDVQKFANFKRATDLFVICSEKDKISLLELIKNCRERKTFVENTHIATTKEGEVEIIQKHLSKNIHFIKSMDKNQHLFEWRYSHGSMESLRYCVTMNSCDEQTLSKTEHNFVLIADEPGMGKTTSLACLSMLIKSAWVIYIEMKNFQTHIDRLPDRFTDKNVANFLLGERRSTDTDRSFAHWMLEYLLQNKTFSKRVVLMFDGFDELDDYVTDKENAKEKIVRLLIFLKNKPSVQIFLTVRKYLKESLERKLSIFSTCFGELNSENQLEFLVKVWKSCLSLELGGFGEEWKVRLKLYSEDLLRQAKQVLGSDIDCFMEVPLQLRMLAKVFRPRIVLAQSPELLCEQFDIFSAPKLYKKFITLKYDIYIHDKTLIGMLGDELQEKDIFNDIAVKHGELGFRSFFSNFYQKYFVNISEEWLNVMNRNGLVQSTGNGNYQFVHRTYAEYFCAQMIVHWVNQLERSQQDSAFKYQLVKEILLSQILLHPGSKVIRMFMNFLLDDIAILETKSKSIVQHIGQLWFKNNSAFRNQEHQTALHIAVQEKNEHIIKLLLSGLYIENTQEAFISFITQYDMNYNTALHVMVKPTFSGEIDSICNRIIRNIFNCIMTCSYEAKEKILFAYLFNRDVSESDISNHLLRSDNISGDTFIVFNKVVTRVREVETEIIPFREGLRENVKLVTEILSERLLLNNIERYCLVSMKHKDHGMKTALHLAAQHGHLAVLELIKEQTSVLFTALMAQRDNKMSPLHTAAQSQNLNIVQFLVESGADMNARCTIGKTALMYATLRGNSQIVKYLFESGTDINSKDNFGRTALYSAAARPREATDDLSDVKYLIESGAEINYRNNEGWSAFHIAVANGNLSIVKYLVEKGAEIHSVGKDGENALYVAAFRGHVSVVEYLLQEGVDPNWPDLRGYTALTWGSLLWKWDVVRVLLDGVADVNADDGAALMYAILAEEWSIVDRLVDKGASIHESDILEIENLCEFKERHPNYEFKPINSPSEIQQSQQSNPN